MITPAQRKYYQDLTTSMRKMSQWIEPRSRKVSDTLHVAADVIEELSARVPVDPAVQLDQHGNKIQPASTPEQAKT